MSEALDPLRFPLHGSRLVEASAGTGKTWTIAALYLRLVLGHGGEQGFARPLLPPEILVMTFTRAATRELANRVRQRLVEAAAYFRDEDGAPEADPYLEALAADCGDAFSRQQAAHRLMLAAETMDEAAIFTIDAWCQRMLREHAFDSGSLFDEELVADESALFEDAAHDYWRQQVYPLASDALGVLLQCWSEVGNMKAALRELVFRACPLPADTSESLGALIGRERRAQAAQLAALKEGWAARADAMEQWIAAQRALAPKCFNGNKMRADSLVKWFEALRSWAASPQQMMPELTPAAWKRLTPAGIADACSGGVNLTAPECFDATESLQAALAQLTPIDHAIIAHASASIGARMAQLKAASGQFGFADLLQRLKSALAGSNGEALRRRITSQYPVAMVDEFQDTSPDQYAVFDALYQVAANDPARGLFLIGDPKQSIYGFRGADIHSYLAARRATEGRHYRLGTNYRSTAALVRAVNQLFLHAEGVNGSGGFAAGAFRFRKGEDNPLPFDEVEAGQRGERLVGVTGQAQALAIAACEQADLKTQDYRDLFAHHCAEHIVGILNDPEVGFEKDGVFRRLAPADVAILVRDRREARAVRQALMARQVRSVYLSDQDSVVDSLEAADLLRWLAAVANPLDGALARAAFATATAGLPLAELARMAADELAWEERIEQLKNLHAVWQRQGVLAMLRRLIHELGLPPKLLAEAGGERRLTNLLHLAELLQTASRGLDGEQALIRWFAEQLAGQGGGKGGSQSGEERVLRLESDAELVKVVTVHKSKGLEYPLVYLPFAVSARRTERKNRSFFEYTDSEGKRRIDLALTEEALAAVDRARLEEDLRLLYVAVTRARHFLWLGVAAIAARKAGENRLHESAFGYLLGGGERIAAEEMAARLGRMRGAAHEAIDIVPLAATDAAAVTRLSRIEAGARLLDAAPFAARFERNWSVGSFTSLSRPSASSSAPMRAQEATLIEEDAAARTPAPAATGKLDEAPWHQFPRGAVPGNFLHEQLEWMAGEGFDCVDAPGFETRLAARCQRAGWGKREADVIAWLRMVASTALPPLQASLAQLSRQGATLLPEMEFWFPSEHLDAGALDRLCGQHLLDGVAYPALPQRQLHGMLKGFADLVFEHEGRFWVLDYKSNALGPNDAAYHRAAMAVGMAAHRYDIQGAIYMLALHRLLKSRLGAAYDPARQLGGAIFLFLRGVANGSTHGCFQIAPDLALLDGLDALFGAGAMEACP